MLEEGSYGEEVVGGCGFGWEEEDLDGNMEGMKVGEDGRVGVCWLGMVNCIVDGGGGVNRGKKG